MQLAIDHVCAVARQQDRRSRWWILPRLVEVPVKKLAGRQGLPRTICRLFSASFYAAAWVWNAFEIGVANAVGVAKMLFRRKLPIFNKHMGFLIGVDVMVWRSVAVKKRHGASAGKYLIVHPVVLLLKRFAVNCIQGQQHMHGSVAVVVAAPNGIPMLWVARPVITKNVFAFLHAHGKLGRKTVQALQRQIQRRQASVCHGNIQGRCRSLQAIRRIAPCRRRGHARNKRRQPLTPSIAIADVQQQIPGDWEAVSAIGPDYIALDVA